MIVWTVCLCELSKLFILCYLSESLAHIYCCVLCWSKYIRIAVKTSLFYSKCQRFPLEWLHWRVMPSNRTINVHHQADFDAFSHRYKPKFVCGLDILRVGFDTNKFPFYPFEFDAIFTDIGHHHQKYVAVQRRFVFLAAHNCDCCIESGLAKRSKSRWISVHNADPSIMVE